MMRAVRISWIRTGVVLGAVILASALAGVGPAAAAPLAQEGTGTITGRVLSLDNVPLADVRLAAFAQAPNTGDRTPLAELTSDSQGRYSVQVPAGTVWMEFLTQDIRGESFWGYSNLPVQVAAGQTVTDQDFRVAIRVVSEPTAPVAPVQPPGMPATGSGADPALPLAAGLSLLLVALGLLQRRRALR
jgi:LPXTG-motif cell wall-anchored protein